MVALVRPPSAVSAVPLAVFAVTIFTIIEVLQVRVKRRSYDTAPRMTGNLSFCKRQLGTVMAGN